MKRESPSDYETNRLVPLHCMQDLPVAFPLTHTNTIKQVRDGVGAWEAKKKKKYCEEERKRDRSVFNGQSI